MKNIWLLLLLASNLWAQVYVFEAESLIVSAGPVVMPVDSEMIFYSWGTIQIPQLNLIGNCEVTIVAKENPLGDEHAKLQIDLPGNSITLDIVAADYQSYAFAIFEGSPGTWSFSYINDYLERRLYIDRIEIRRAPFPGKVTISWDKNTEVDLAGYKIYQGYASRSYTVFYDMKMDTTMTLLLPDSVYYFTLTAYDTAGNESAFAVELLVPIKNEVQTDTTLIADYNGDGRVDFQDMVAFDGTFAATCEGEKYIEFFDFLKDCFIDFGDMMIFDDHFGDTSE